MTFEEYALKDDQLRARQRQEKMDLRIARYGGCPKEKDHFDKLSFFIGVFFGACWAGIFTLVLLPYFR